MAVRAKALRATSEQLEERAARLLQEARERNILTFAITAVSGFTLGLLTGILFAPASGHETRHRMSDRASGMVSSVREMARRRAREVSEKAEEIA